MIKLMEQEPEKFDNITHDGPQNSFIKGMSLQEYMSKKVSDYKETLEEENDTEENLYQSSGNHQMAGLGQRNIDYCINQIDEQSVEDSNQSNMEQSFHIRQGQKQRNQQDFRNAMPVNDWRVKISGISMNSTAYFKNEKQEKNSFRVKRMSVSPSKKFEKNMANGSITIYGSRFGQMTQKKTVNMPQIVTFYGKLNTNQPHKNNELTMSKDTFKKKQMKAIHTRKNQLNLNQLLEYESRIKKNRASHTHLQEIKINRMNKINQKLNHCY